MAAFQKAVATTFDTAVERIGDSINRIEETGEPLDAWQSDMLARAMAYLRTGNYAIAIDAAFRACRPQLYRTRAAEIALIGGPTLTIAEARAYLEEAQNRPPREL